MTAVILGLAVGIVMGLTGTGGGILAVPLLILGLHLSVPEAAPIGLLAAGLAAGVGAALGLRQGIVRYKAAALMASTGMLMAPMGLWLSRQLNVQLLSAIFAALLFVLAFKAFNQAKSQQLEHANFSNELPCVQDNIKGRFIWSIRCARALSLFGAIAGFLSGLLGVGGGFILVPALTRFTTLSTHAVITTSLAVIALIAFSGVASSIVAGTVQWHYAIPFTLGAMSGMLVGRAFSGRLKSHQLEKVFAWIVMAVAIGILSKVAIFILGNS